MAGSLPVDAQIFFKTTSPQSLMIITRWAAKTSWGTVDATIHEYDGVDFKDRCCVECEIRPEVVEYMASKGFGVEPFDYYKYSLTKTVSKKAQYNIILHVDKTQFLTDDCPEAKDYLRQVMANSIVVKQ